MKKTVIYFFVAFLAVAVSLHAGERQTQQLSLSKTTNSVADYVHYTTVGQLGLTVTNFGIIGEGYNNPDQPSCMYKQYPDNLKEQVEHMSYGGLWVGGMVNGEKRVTTAVVDGVFDYGAAGFEFTDNGDSIIERSSIPTSKVYSPYAISHQDYIAEFNDEGDVVNHTPLHINVELRTHTWNYSFTEAFVILDYEITNIGSQDIQDMYIGIWADASVGNMNYTSTYEPGGGWSWYDNLNGYDETIFDPVEDDEFPGIHRNIAYQYDVDGDNGYAESYFGMTCLGSESVPRAYWDSYYSQWVWNTSSNLNYPEYVLPLTDAERYDRMGSSVPKRKDVEGYSETGYPDQANSWMILIGSGPFGTAPENSDSSIWILRPNETCQIAYAICAGRWANGDILDTDDRRSYLQNNADWAQKAYNGEDSNGNGVLDSDEDQNDNNLLDRYILPAPPPSPKLLAVPDAGKVTLYWNDLPESFEDPVTRETDFEGYRIYARRKTSNLTAEWSLLADFDLDDDMGYNTGLDFIRIKDELGFPSYEVIGTDTFQYKFENSNLLNGWPDKNIFSITSYDSGDPSTGLTSLESSTLENRIQVITGRKASNVDSLKVGVYPNPYRVSAAWDGSGVRDRMIWFTGLPENANIHIFTMSGEPVKTIYHDGSSYNGSDLQRLDSGLSSGTVFAGGEHPWDLITDHDQALATGMYLFSVEDTDTGLIKTGKFLVIK